MHVLHKRGWQHRVGSCAWAQVPQPLVGMVDVLDNKGPPSTRKRGPEKGVRRVKRAKPTCDPQDTRQEFEHAPASEEGGRGGGDIVKAVVAADIRALAKKASDWVSRLPKLFHVAVPRQYMLVQVFRQCRPPVDQCGVDGHVNPSTREVLERLALSLRPLLPEVPREIVRKFLTNTGLDEVVKDYIDFLVRASRLGLRFSNNLGMEETFDPSAHMECNEGLLVAGDGCRVVFPGARMEVGVPKRLLVASKPCVLPTQAPEEEESLRREILL